MNRELTIPERIIKFATNKIGLQEIKGAEDNPKIVQMFADIGHSWVKDDETAWCSCFVNWIAFKLDLNGSNKLNARSWLDVGEEIQHPLPGDIVIYWRESKGSWKGHVGIFVGFNKVGNIFTLGGNQGNEVNITIYHKDRLLGFRRLTNKKP